MAFIQYFFLYSVAATFNIITLMVLIAAAIWIPVFWMKVAAAATWASLMFLFANYWLPGEGPPDLVVDWAARAFGAIVLICTIHGATRLFRQAFADSKPPPP
jgi:hypothetical protein